MATTTSKEEEKASTGLTRSEDEKVNSIQIYPSEMQQPNSNVWSAGSGSTERRPEDPLEEKRDEHKETSLLGDTCPCQVMDKQDSVNNKSTSINLNKHGFIVCPVSPAADDDHLTSRSRSRSETASKSTAATSSSFHPPPCSSSSSSSQQPQLVLLPPPPETPTPHSPNISSVPSDRHGNVTTIGALDSYTLHPGLSLNNNNNNQDTITSVRSRCVSISRRTYNTTDFNQEFSKIDDSNTNKTNPFKRMVKSTAFKRTTTATAATTTEQPVNQQKAPLATGAMKRVKSGSVNRQNDLSLSRRSSNSSNVSQMSPIGITPDDEGDTEGADQFDRRKKRGPGGKALSYLRKLFPIVKSFKNYSREDLVSDCISALTVIVFHVPQAMGYSLIAQVPPVVGLYTAIFPAFVYSLMGTSKHCAVGSFAVICLMTGNLITTARQELNSSLPLAYAYASAVPTALADESVTKSSVHQPHPGASTSPDLVLVDGNGNTGQSQRLDVQNIAADALSASFFSSSSSPPFFSLHSSIEHPFIENAGTTTKTIPPSLLSPRDSTGASSVHHHSNTDEELWINVRIAVVVTCIMGIYQLLFGLMRMGFISIYLSEQLISGFTTAASVYVFTSQLTFLLGLHLPHRSGPLALVTSYLDIIRNISHVNPATVSISILSCFVLALFKLYLNDKLKQWYKINIPFPIELILVVVGTLLSYSFNLQERHNIDVVGVIPSGLPVPTCPDYKLVFYLAKKTIPLAIVAYTLTISVGKIFAVKHNYSIDPNQELIALGSLNVVSSFFSCLPSAASLSRSAVQESSGGKTQLVSLINSAGIIFVLYFAGFLLAKLPTCLLAAIISIALKSLFLQVKDFFRFWKVSKLDGSIWLITFIAVILLDVDIGLYVGLAYSLITLIYKSQRPKTYLLGSINYSDVYVPLKKYAQAMNVPGIVIYQFCGPLHFANTEFFRNDLTRKTGVLVSRIRKQLDRSCKRHKEHMTSLQFPLRQSTGDKADASTKAQPSDTREKEREETFQPSSSSFYFSSSSSGNFNCNFNSQTRPGQCIVNKSALDSESSHLHPSHLPPSILHSHANRTLHSPHFPSSCKLSSSQQMISHSCSKQDACKSTTDVNENRITDIHPLLPQSHQQQGHSIEQTSVIDARRKNCTASPDETTLFSTSTSSSSSSSSSSRSSSPSPSPSPSPCPSIPSSSSSSSCNSFTPEESIDPSPRCPELNGANIPASAHETSEHTISLNLPKQSSQNTESLGKNKVYMDYLSIAMENTSPPPPVALKVADEIEVKEKESLLPPHSRSSFPGLEHLPSHIIIDCSMISYIDTAGVSTLKATVLDYESIGITTYLAGVATHVHRMLELDSFYKQVPSNHVYIALHDAIHHAQQDQLGLPFEEDLDNETNIQLQNNQTATAKESTQLALGPSLDSGDVVISKHKCDAMGHPSIVGFFESCDGCKISNCQISAGPSVEKGDK